MSPLGPSVCQNEIGGYTILEKKFGNVTGAIPQGAEK